MSKSFYFRDNQLFCEDIDLLEFSETHPTPYYIYSKNEIIKNCKQILDAGKGINFMPCYALKANYNPQLLKIIRELGFGADVVSGGELQFALKAGFAPHKIMFAGVGKTAEEIRLAIKSDIHSLNVESAGELKIVSRVAAELKRKVRIAFRVNPDIDAQTHHYISTGLHSNKFGIAVDEAFALFKSAQQDDWLDPQGIHVHIGSQITNNGPYLNTVDFLKNFQDNLEKSGIKIRFLDLGGGIGINYHNNFIDKDQHSTFINTILPSYLDGLKYLNVELIAELGRSVIGSAGLLISKVLYNKRTPLKNFLIVDAAMNNLIRPSLYDAHHEIIPLKKNNNHSVEYDIVGPICESGDFLAKGRNLQALDDGDHVAVGGSGAYGQALASNYNLRPKIAEYLVDGAEVQTIFEAETIDTIAKQYGWK